MDLSDRVAIVTGSGRGIGREIALKLAEVGASIVINDIGEASSVENVVEEIKAMNRESLAVMADVSSSSDVERLVAETMAAYGKVDILVNNAGITRDQLLLRMLDEDWDKVISVNLKSVFLCTRAVLKHMVKQRRGRIISIASIVGIVGNAGQANYASSKAGVIALTKSLARELGKRNVCVNAIAPGFILTEMTEKLPDKVREEYIANIPLKRAGAPKDIAEVVSFLISPAASYITGTVINVSGGLLI